MRLGRVPTIIADQHLDAVLIEFGFQTGCFRTGHICIVSVNRIRLCTAPLGQIGIGVACANLHGAAVDRLLEPFGQLHLGRTPPLAHNHLGRDVAPKYDNHVSHYRILRFPAAICAQLQGCIWRMATFADAETTDGEFTTRVQGKIVVIRA